MPWSVLSQNHTLLSPVLLLHCTDKCLCTGLHLLLNSEQEQTNTHHIHSWSPEKWTRCPAHTKSSKKKVTLLTNREGQKAHSMLIYHQAYFYTKAANMKIVFQRVSTYFWKLSKLTCTKMNFGACLSTASNLIISRNKLFKVEIETSSFTHFLFHIQSPIPGNSPSER